MGGDKDLEECGGIAIFGRDVYSGKVKRRRRKGYAFT